MRPTVKVFAAPYVRRNKFIPRPRGGQYPMVEPAHVTERRRYLVREGTSCTQWLRHVTELIGAVRAIWSKSLPYCIARGRQGKRGVRVERNGTVQITVMGGQTAGRYGTVSLVYKDCPTPPPPHPPEEHVTGWMGGGQGLRPGRQPPLVCRRMYSQECVRTFMCVPIVPVVNIRHGSAHRPTQCLGRTYVVVRVVG